MNVRVGEMGRIRARLCREERGQNLVELALVLPIILLLVFGIIDFARAFNYKDQTTQIANETARWIIVDQIPGTLGPNLLQYKQWACGETVSNELKTSVGCPAGTAMQICFKDSGGGTVAAPVAGGLVTVSIPATLTPISYLTKVIPGFSALKLNGQAQMRVELTATNSSFGSADPGC